MSDTWRSSRVSFAVINLQMPITCVLRKAVPSGARLATNSLCQYAEDIIARYTAAATKPPGGKLSALIRWWRPVRYGLRRTHCRWVWLTYLLNPQSPQPPALRMGRLRSERHISCRKPSRSITLFGENSLGVNRRGLRTPNPIPSAAAVGRDTTLLRPQIQIA